MRNTISDARWCHYIAEENRIALKRLERLNKWHNEAIRCDAYQPTSMEGATIKFKRWVKAVFTLDAWLKEGFGA